MQFVNSLVFFLFAVSFEHHTAVKKIQSVKMFVQTASRIAPVARTAVSRNLFFRYINYYFFFILSLSTSDAMKFSDFSDKWIAFIENIKYVLMIE